MDIERINQNPYGAYNFTMEIDGAVVAGFQDISGLDSENTPIEYRAGGDPTNATRKLPGMLKLPNVVCNRGITGNLYLWNWRKEVRDGGTAFPPTRNVVIQLLDEQHLDRAAAGAAQMQPRRDDARVVDDHQRAPRQLVRQVAEAPVPHRADRAVVDEQPRLVPALERMLRDQLGRQLVVEIRELHEPSVYMGAPPTSTDAESAHWPLAP